MLPLLCLRAMNSGSSRESVMDELLVCSLPPEPKELAAACRRYSSSTSRLLFCRSQKKTPPMMAASATTPTTTPTAMPTVFDFFSGAAVGGGAAVWLTCNVDVAALVDEDEDELERMFSGAYSKGLRSFPVVMTHSLFFPPQMEVLSPLHPVLQEELLVLVDSGGTKSPHQQLVPSERPRMFLPSCRQMSWHFPGLAKGPKPWSSRGTPVWKHPIVCMALAGSVVVGSAMDTILDADELWAEAMDNSDAAAARADTNLMENMMCGMWKMEGG